MCWSMPRVCINVAPVRRRSCGVHPPTASVRESATLLRFIKGLHSMVDSCLSPICLVRRLGSSMEAGRITVVKLLGHEAEELIDEDKDDADNEETNISIGNKSKTRARDKSQNRACPCGRQKAVGSYESALPRSSQECRMCIHRGRIGEYLLVSKSIDGTGAPVVRGWRVKSPEGQN
jgi:hypothetical protein